MRSREKNKLNKTCCFTGHRKISAKLLDTVSVKLKEAVNSAIQNGYRYFIGGAVGFDTLSAQAILNAKQEHKRKKINLILAIPYPEQADGWDDADIDEYERIKALADEVVYISKEKKKGCMYARNRYMIDNSSLCIAYMTRKTGGTVYTVKYAQENNKKIYNIAETKAKQGFFSKFFGKKE